MWPRGELNAGGPPLYNGRQTPNCKRLPAPAGLGPAERRIDHYHYGPASDRYSPFFPLFGRPARPARRAGRPKSGKNGEME